MRCTLNIIKIVSKLFILALFMVGCEKESTSPLDVPANVNTLGDISLGGSEGAFSDYFYDLSSDFNAKFFYYQKDGSVVNTILAPGLLNPNRDTLNLRTFSDFILKVEPQDLNSQTSVSIFDETANGCSVISDTCPDIDGDGALSSISEVSDIPQADSLIIYSHQFSSILKLEWDVDDNRYKNVLEEYEYTSGDSEYTSQWLQGSDTVYVDENVYKYDSLIYMTALDTILTSAEGQFYFDQSEYIKRDSVYSVSDIQLSVIFPFERYILATDSIMYRTNTDCNLDGLWTPAEQKLVDYNNDGDSLDVIFEFNDADGSGKWDEGENFIFDYDGNGSQKDVLYEFEDLGNGSSNSAEIYWDKNSNNSRDGNEPFEDLNCNGIWDATETSYEVLETQFDCEASELSLTWDTGKSICFKDKGNGLWDAAEYYQDQNLNGLWDDGEKLSKRLNQNDGAANLLVDYTDPDLPQPIFLIAKNTTIKLRDQSTYDPIIQDSIYDVVQKTIPRIDSVRTIFSNKVISQITDSTLFGRDYKILKSQYPNNSSTKNYNYSILDDTDDNVVRLHYPSYFLPYGFYTQPSQIADGFWYEDYLDLETVFYTYNGNIRDGEHVFFDSVKATTRGDYHIETDYLVERPSLVTVPMKKVLSATCNTSDLDYPNCAVGLNLSAYDTTLSDCYSIIKTMTMTMLGSGVEFGQRTTTTLAKGLGIVEESVEIRWSEQIGVTGEVWSEYSRIELNDLRVVSELGRAQGMLNDLSGDTKIYIEELNQLDGDSFIKSRSAGIQAVKLPSN